MSAENFHQVAGDLEALLEQVEENEIVGADSSDLEYLGGFQNASELLDYLQEENIDVETDSDIEIDVVTVSDSEFEAAPIGELANVALEPAPGYNLRPRNRRSIPFPRPQRMRRKRDRRPLFDIEKILAVRKVGRRRKYFVKFFGYAEKENQWVWATDVVNIKKKKKKMCE